MRKQRVAAIKFLLQSGRDIEARSLLLVQNKPLELPP